MAQQKGQSLKEMLQQFAQNNLEGWVRERFDPTREESKRENEIKWLTRIFTYYCDPMVRPSILLRQ